MIKICDLNEKPILSLRKSRVTVAVFEHFLMGTECAVSTFKPLRTMFLGEKYARDRIERLLSHGANLS